MRELKDSSKAVLRWLGVSAGRYRVSYAGSRERLLRSAGVEEVFDVGANAGQYAMELRRTGYGSRITSFEPATKPFALLQEACRKDRLWTAHNWALGASSGTAALRLHSNSYFNSMLEMRDDLPEVWGGGSAGFEDVETHRLDEFAPVSTRFALKVDVQGFEGEVIAGAGDLMRLVSVVELELSPQEVYAGQKTMVHMMEAMEGHGLTLAAATNAYTLSTGQSLQLNGIFARQQHLTHTG